MVRGICITVLFDDNTSKGGCEFLGMGPWVAIVIVSLKNNIAITLLIYTLHDDLIQISYF